MEQYDCLKEGSSGKRSTKQASPGNPPSLPSWFDPFAGLARRLTRDRVRDPKHVKYPAQLEISDAEFARQLLDDGIVDSQAEADEVVAMSHRMMPNFSCF